VIRIEVCDSRQTPFPAEYFHAAITSPPYFGLRRYGSGAAEIGAEESPESYVASLVAVGREVRRVLRGDGVWWLNLGDTYSNGDGAQSFRNAPNANRDGTSDAQAPRGSVERQCGVAPKNLLLIPARVALALQADGWVVRAEIPWLKRNVMPGSQQDRPTVGHETIYLLTKGPRYYFDLDAVRRAHGDSRVAPTWEERKAAGEPMRRADPGESGYVNRVSCIGKHPAGRSWRTTDPAFDSLDDLRDYLAHVASVAADGGLLASPEGDPLALAVNTTPSRLKHFAMWPPRLVAEMVRSGTSEHGCCAECGAPWRRVVETERKKPAAPSGMREVGRWAERQEGGVGGRMLRTALGWQPTCAHSAPVVPCRVFDPFSGSGTTAAVAEALGREGYGCELNPAYAALSDERRAEVRAALLGEERAPEVDPRQRTLFDLMGATP